jgi:hypothetical protein
MRTQEVPVSVSSETDNACAHFGTDLPTLVQVGLRLVEFAASSNTGHIAALTEQPNWAGTYTILAQERIQEIVAKIQGDAGQNPSAPPTI